MSKSVLVFGGDKDFNLTRFTKRLLTRNDVEIRYCIFGQSGDPKYNYDIKNKILYLDDKAIEVDSVFMRYDVFNYLDSGNALEHHRSQAFYSGFLGWLNNQEKIKVLNKNFYKSTRINKISSLLLAEEAGFAIPETYVSNDLTMLNKKLIDKSYIYKEIEGGAHTEELTQENFDLKSKAKADYPFFIQEKLIQPELRVFRVAEKYFSFDMITDALDYRVNDNVRIEYIETPKDIIEKTRKVTDALGLNFSALDLKTHKDSGDLMFLEANSQPMFAAFDEIADYAITDAIIDFLLD